MKQVKKDLEELMLEKLVEYDDHLKNIQAEINQFKRTPPLSS